MSVSTAKYFKDNRIIPYRAIELYSPSRVNGVTLGEEMKYFSYSIILKN